MGTIPGTKFTELAPPAETGQMPWSPSLASTGGEQAMVRGIEKMGKAITAYAINTMEQEMALEYSERERTIDELGWAARNSVTGDEEADKKLWEKFQQDAQAIAVSSKYKDVNDNLTEHINSVSPNWEQGIYISSLNKRRENVKDQFNLEYEAHLENGRVPEANALVEKGYKLGIITQAEYDNFVKTAPTESRLLKAERLRELGNNDAALAELKMLKPEDLTNKQLQRKNALMSDAEKARDNVSSALLNDVFGKIADGMPLSDVGELIKQTVGISEIQKTKLMETAINADKIWRKEGMNPWTQTDEQGYAKLSDLLIDIRKGKVKSLDEIDKTWLEGDKPNFAFNYWRMAQNDLADMQKPTESGYTRTHPIMKTYIGSGTEMGVLDKIFGKKTKDGWEIVDRKGHVEAIAAFEAYAKSVWGQPDYARKIDDYYESLVKPVKEEKTKGILNRIASVATFGAPYPFILQLGTSASKNIFNQEIKSPYADYPDAFLEDGVWKVVKDGKKYRIQE